LITRANNKGEIIAKVLYLYRTHAVCYYLNKNISSFIYFMFYLHFKPEQFLRENIVCIVMKPGKTK